MTQKHASWLFLAQDHELGLIMIGVLLITKIICYGKSSHTQNMRDCYNALHFMWNYKINPILLV